MGRKENWKLFVESAKMKSESHLRVAQHWERVDTMINVTLIVFSTITTILSLFEDHKYLPYYVTAAVSGVTTLLSALSGFLQPHQRRQAQLESSKEFNGLMMKMIRCTNEADFERLWYEYNKATATEPFLPKKYCVALDVSDSMTAELCLVFEKHEEEIYRKISSFSRGGDFQDNPGASSEGERHLH